MLILNIDAKGINTFWRTEMKLVRYGPKGKEKPGLIDQNGNIRDLSRVVEDIRGETLTPKGLAQIMPPNWTPGQYCYPKRFKKN